MALEQITLNPGAGGADLSLDQVGAGYIPVTKIALGADGVFDTLVSSTDPMPVGDNGGSLTVDNGGTFVVQENGAALTALQIMDDWDESDRCKSNIIVGQAGIAAGTGVDGANVPRVTLATDVPLPAGTNAIGKLSANDGVDIGDVDVTSVPAPLSTTGGGTEAAALRVTLANNSTGTLTVDAANDSSLNVRIGDGSNTATIRNLSANDALNVAIVDASGNQITSFGGAGGTSAIDDAAFTAGSGSGTPAMGFYSSDTVNSGDVGVLAMDANRRLIVNVDANTVGLATSSAQGTGNASLATIAGDTTSLDGKITACNTGAVVVSSGTITAVTAITNALPAGTNSIGSVGVPAVTTGGATPGKLISAASTNATSVKGSAATLYSLQVFNTNAAARYLKLYNKSSAPTVGSDTPVQVFTIPGNTAGAGLVVPIPTQGIAFSAGLAFALTTGAADSDTGAVAANEIVVSYSYK